MIAEAPVHGGTPRLTERAGLFVREDVLFADADGAENGRIRERALKALIYLQVASRWIVEDDNQRRDEVLLYLAPVVTESSVYHESSFGFPAGGTVPKWLAITNKSVYEYVQQRKSRSTLPHGEFERRMQRLGLPIPKPSAGSMEEYFRASFDEMSKPLPDCFYARCGDPHRLEDFVRHEVTGWISKTLTLYHRPNIYPPSYSYSRVSRVDARTLDKLFSALLGARTREA